MRNMLCLLMAALLMGACQERSAPAQIGEESSPNVIPVKRNGQYVGFDVVVGGTVIAPIRFSSGELITVAQLEEKAEHGQALRFSGLHAKPGTGLAFEPSDYVLVKCTPHDG